MKMFFSITDSIAPENREDQLLYFKQLFGNSNQLTVEIGSGNGHFLVSYALQHPDKNCIGTEILGGRARKFHSKIEKRGLKNIAVFKGDARQFVWEFLYEDTVQEFIIMFPDPWPKKRHHKHRLLKSSFIEMLHHRLVPGGSISITTDNIPYRNWIMSEFQNTKGFYSPFEEGYIENPCSHPMSLFEEKYRKEKRVIFFIQYRKM